MVWKLDRMARSTRQLPETVEALEQRGIGLRILTQNMDTASAGGRLGVSSSTLYRYLPAARHSLQEGED